MRELALDQAAQRAALLEGTHNVLVTASEPVGSCAHCGGPMIVRKTLVRQGRTLAHGTFRVHETEYVCRAGCLDAFQRRFRARPSDLEDTLLPDSSVGYDVMVYVGLQRYLHHRQRDEIRQCLERDYGVTLSTGETSRLAHLFLAYLERLHHERRERIRRALDQDGGWPLHIDATGEDGRGTLLVLYAGWRGWVLGAFKIPTENADAIRPCIDEVAGWAGLPLAIVRDLGRAMIPACESFRSDAGGDFPILSCHYHFLADVGQDLLDPGHGELRDLFRRFRTRPGLRALVRELGRRLGEDIAHVRQEVLSWQEQGGPGHQLPEGLQGLGVVRSLAQWVLDYPIQSKGQDFPFALPYLDLFDRSTLARRAVEAFLRTPPADPEVLRALNRLAAIVDPVQGEVPFRAVTRNLRQRQRLFDELREALRLVPKNPGRAGPPAPESPVRVLKDIQRDVERLRASLEQRRPARSARKAIDLILDHLHRHADSLWGHQITLPDALGGGHRFVERTNDIIESFFRSMKHGERRRSGRKSLTQDFEALPPAAALAQTLRRPDYVAVLCGTLQELPQAFAGLDAKERQGCPADRVPSQDGAALHPALSTATASLPLEDRRIIRSPSLTACILSAATAKAPRNPQTAASAS